MKSISLKMLSLLMLAGITASVPAMHAVARWNDHEDEGKTLEGTWITQVTLLDCQSHSALGVPFVSMGSFAPGGTMTETTSSPAFFPAQRSPGHGVWVRTGHHSYKTSSMALITLNGTLVKTQTITQLIEMKTPDEFVTTAASVQFFEPNGTPIASSGCATAVSTRFDLQK
jgi:hypothetical protein